MRKLVPAVDGVSLCDAVSEFGLPPTTYAIVPSGWSGLQGADPSAGVVLGSGTIPEVDVEIWADGAVDLTGVELYVASLHPFTFSPITVVPTPVETAFLDLSTKTTNCTTVIEAKVDGPAGEAFTIAFVESAGVSPTTGTLVKTGNAYVFTFKTAVTTVANFETLIAASPDLAVKTPGGVHVLATSVDEFAATNLGGDVDAYFTADAHGLLTGDGPFQYTATTAPAGLALLTDYWAIVLTDNTFSVADSLADALAGNVVQFTTTGTGTKKVNADADCQRVHWTSHGLLGVAGDGAIDLDAQTAYWSTVPNRPRSIAYALDGTVASGDGLVSAAIYPVWDMG